MHGGRAAAGRDRVGRLAAACGPCRDAARSASSKAIAARSRPASCRMPRPARQCLAEVIGSRRPAPSAMPSPTAPIAARGCRSCDRSPTTGRGTSMARFRMCPDCAREYRRPGRPTVSRAAQCLPGLRATGCGWRMQTAPSPAPIPIADTRNASAGRRASSPSRASAGFIWPATRPAPIAVAELRRRKRRAAKPLCGDGPRYRPNPALLRGQRSREPICWPRSPHRSCCCDKSGEASHRRRAGPEPDRLHAALYAAASPAVARGRPPHRPDLGQSRPTNRKPSTTTTARDPPRTDRRFLAHA